MKVNTFLVLTPLATVMASPTPQVGDTTVSERNPLEGIVQREICRHPGECGWFNSGQCEYHCDGYGGFDFMEDCGWKRKSSMPKAPCFCGSDVDGRCKWLAKFLFQVRWKTTA
ncbi:uncharacterized protein B0H64DRAFT_442943 [Chaetomium fimeti]|uniref:Uncharacterized protein n=1 Tax=Chaetomium fimeti TaxID=1854472 RepID=A0AAE0LQS7_9PEZI|nr:hypothetical protein B0H64DRAFT_442943 [Chaetomium fimeti]